MKRQYLLALDTETGGLDPARDALLSVALVPSWDFEPLVVYLLPEGEIDKEAAEINGYTPELWAEKGAVPLKQGLRDIQLYLAACGARTLCPPVVAHNAGFDRSFLEAAQKKGGVGLDLPGKRWRCSQMSFAFVADACLCATPPDFSLNSLGAASGFWKKRGGRSAHHDALEDAECALHGYEWMLGLTKEGGVA